MTPRRPTVVVLRALGLGDLLTAVPALRALADAFPGHHRMLATPAVLAPLAHHSGAVDEVVDAALDKPLDARLAGADVAVNLHGRGPQSHELLAATGPRRLIAFANPEVPWSAGGPRWRPGEHQVACWCRLLRESGIPADPRRLDLAPPGPPPEGCGGATLIHPGAKSGARRWPPERFAAVARAEVARGRAVVVSGGPGESELASHVAGLAGSPRLLTVSAGGGDLLALARLVATAGRVLCGDTGVAHLATALGTPSVVLFGPISPAEWGPPPERPWHRALWKGSTGNPHAREPDPGLLQITVGEVLEALHDLPERPAARQGSAAPLR